MMNTNLTTNQYQYLTKKVPIAASILIFLCLSIFSINGNAAPLKIGEMAPNFTVKSLNGDTVKLSDFINKKPVYLKFWATWCSYCKVEMPHLQAIFDENGKHIEVLTVNVGMNDSISNIERYYQKNGLTLPTVFDQKGSLTSRYGVVGTPYHVLIDKQGSIAYQTFLVTDLLDKKITTWAQESRTEKAAASAILAKGAVQ
jgi:peroxiredoxin